MTDKYPPRTPEQESQYQAYLVAKVEYDKREKLRNAAPDLLAALKLLLSSAHDYQTGISEAQEAIAKAEAVK